MPGGRVVHFLENEKPTFGRNEEKLKSTNQRGLIMLKVIGIKNKKNKK